MKKKKYSHIVFPLLAIALVVGLVFFQPAKNSDSESGGSETFSSTIEDVVSDSYDKDAGIFVQELRVKIEEGSQSGQIITINNDENFMVNRRVFEEGDKVLVVYEKEQDYYYISEYVRSGTLGWLFALFVAVVIFVAGWQGIGSLAGMVFSFVVLLKLVLPLIISGTATVIAAILGAVIIIPMTFYSSHGVNRKTTVAIFGTLMALVIAAVLATIFADLGHLTGLASEETTYLKLSSIDKIDFRGLVLAGMMISILGILDDITISQASVVEELKGAKENIGFGELYKRSMQVGRDHIASMVNTLILVYTGASLPLLLLFMDHSQTLMQTVNLEFIAEEIIRTLVGSIALILAVPVTSVLAALVINKGDSDEGHTHKHCHR